jgi:hypothetical protein
MAHALSAAIGDPLDEVDTPALIVDLDALDAPRTPHLRGYH